MPRFISLRGREFIPSSLYHQSSSFSATNCKLGFTRIPGACGDKGGFNEQLRAPRRMSSVGHLASSVWTVAAQCSRIVERLRDSHFAARPDADLRTWAQTQRKSDPACLDGLGHVRAWLWFLLAGRAGAALLTSDDGRADADGRP